MKTVLLSVATGRTTYSLESRVTDECADALMEASRGGIKASIDGVLVAQCPAWLPGPLRSVWLRVSAALLKERGE